MASLPWMILPPVPPKSLSCTHTCLSSRGPYSPCTHLLWGRQFRPGPLFSELLTLICFPTGHMCHLQNGPGTSAVVLLVLMSVPQYPDCAGISHPTSLSSVCSPLVQSTGRLSSKAVERRKVRQEGDEGTGELPPLLTETVIPERI